MTWHPTLSSIERATDRPQDRPRPVTDAQRRATALAVIGTWSCWCGRERLHDWPGKDGVPVMAENATNGYMLGPAGKKAGIDPYSLFTGPESRARKYASPELKEWFDQNGRPTVADFQAQMTGQKVGAGPRDFYASVTWDDVAAVIELSARAHKEDSVTPAPPQAPPRRRGVTPLTPMRVQAAKSMTKLADHMKESHPDMLAHQHVRDAARMLRSGNEDAAQRHLRAAMFAMTPQSLMRNGLHTDDDHIAARDAMHAIHRHLLLTKDIADVNARNQQAIRRDSGDGFTTPPAPDPNNGYGPGALAQKPTARQPPGDQALNAPNRTSSGGNDPAVADPVGPQPKGSKQFAYSWNDLAAVIEMATRPKVVDLIGDGHGHHIPGTPDVYRHGFIPIDGTEVGSDGIRRPGGSKAAKAVKAAPSAKAAAGTAALPKSILTGSHPADKMTVATDKSAAAKSLSDGDLKSADQELTRRAVALGKPGQLSKGHKAVRAEMAAHSPAPKTPAAPATAPEKPGTDPAKILDAALKSGVASQNAPGSKKVALSQGKQGSTRVVTFNDGSQYIHKDFKGMTDNRPPILGGTGGLMLPEQQHRQVAKEILASKISKVIGAGAPDIMGDPGSPSGLYEPKVAGVSAVEHFKASKKGMAEMFKSPEGAKIGLMDALTGNEDRHMGNVMVGPGGKPIPIDHNDTWGTPDFDGGLFTDSPFTDALYKQIDAGKSPFTTADLDQVQAKIQALKPEFEAMPGGGGAKNYQMTMDKLAQIRERVAGQ